MGLSATSTAASARRGLCRSLSMDDWQTCGLHPTLGSMTVAQIVARFLADHLEEHAAQLDELVSGTAGV